MPERPALQPRHLDDAAPTRAIAYDEHDAFLCACKGEPYTADEWEREVERLDIALRDATRRLFRARAHGVCMPARFSA